MKLRELGERTGTPVATIKFYLREGLLPAGELVTATLASYGEAHVLRLETIRALRQAVGLSVAQVRAVLRLIDGDVDRIEVLKALQTVVQGLGAPKPGRTEAGNRIVRERGWPDVPTGARAALDDHLEAMDRLGVQVADAVLSAYSEAVDQIALADLADAVEAEDLERLVAHTAVGMHMNAQLVLRLLALAQSSRSIQRYGPAAPGPSLLSPQARAEKSAPRERP